MLTDDLGWWTSHAMSGMVSSYLHAMAVEMEKSVHLIIFVIVEKIVRI
jgi:hypothetical protein